VENKEISRSNASNINIDPPGPISTNSGSLQTDNGLKTLTKILLFCGFCFITYGAISFSKGYVYQGNNLTPPDYNKMQEVNDVLGWASYGSASGIAVTDAKSNIRYSCNIGRCGYPYIEGDIDKSVNLLVYNRIIYQIKVEGTVKLSYSDSVKANTSSIFWGILYGGLGIAVIIIPALLKLFCRMIR